MARRAKWTTDVLKEHYDSLFTERDLRFEQRFQAQLSAIKAESEDLGRRLDSVNEFRETLRDQAGTFALRAETEAKFKSLDDKIDRMQEAVTIGPAMDAGKAAARAAMVTALAILVPVAVAIVVALSR